MCGMCTPPAALGLQCIYSVRSVSSGMQQGASKPFALTFSCLQSHKARIVSMQFLEPAACMCCWFEDAHSPCLARILEKWESFSQKDFRCTHTQLHHVLYNRWGLYGLGLQVGPVWSRLSRTALQSRQAASCLQVTESFLWTVNSLLCNQLGISEVLKRVAS